MNLIVAVDKNWGIGKNGGLLTNLPEDMKFFRTTTADSVVILGRKTLESFPGGKPLKNRVNIVLTRNENIRADGFTVVKNTEEALFEAKKYEGKNIFVIGGESIYRQFLPYCKRAYVTKMDADFNADTFMENLDEKKEWQVVFESEEKEHEGLKFRFLTYEKQ